MALYLENWNIPFSPSLKVPSFKHFLRVLVYWLVLSTIDDERSTSGSRGRELVTNFVSTRSSAYLFSQYSTGRGGIGNFHETSSSRDARDDSGPNDILPVRGRELHVRPNYEPVEAHPHYLHRFELIISTVLFDRPRRYWKHPLPISWQSHWNRWWKRCSRTSSRLWNSASCKFWFHAHFRMIWHFL